MLQDSLQAAGAEGKDRLNIWISQLQPSLKPQHLIHSIGHAGAAAQQVS